MNQSSIIRIAAVAVCMSFQASPQGLPTTRKPEDAGFSSERLKRIAQVFQGDVDKGQIPGAVLLIARNGSVPYFQAFGFQDRPQHLPMKTDSIFRIASMTKPLTSVAIMMLAEEGKIDLGAPVSQYLPEFKDLKVGVEKAGSKELSLEAPARAMTVQDLLRHTSGLTYGFFGNSLVDQAYVKANLFVRDQTLAGLVTKLSKLPLAHQPGTVWEYSLSTDVLGRIVEVVSGMVLDRFIRERITQPLKMPDTTFYVTAQQAARMAEPQMDPATGQRPSTIPPIQAFTTKPGWMSGGGGLVSTASDYARFCQMLLNGGEIDGVRLLSPKTIALMTSDHLPPGIPRSPGIVSALGELAPTPELGQGFGLGFAVRTQAGRNPLPGSPGDFFWAGITGTYFWVDPKEKLLAVLMIQVPFAQTNHYFRIARELVYQALIR